MRMMKMVSQIINLLLGFFTGLVVAYYSHESWCVIVKHLKKENKERKNA